MKSNLKHLFLRIISRILLVFVGLVGLIILAEGTLSLGTTLLAVSRNAEPVPVQYHFIEHDELLGWRIKPGLNEPHAYGDWRPLTTTPSGFRGSQPPAQSTEEEVHRILCSGGSSVFGVGLGNDETWCGRLGLADSRVETINAGQPAHDPGQSWLYLKDRVSTEFDLLLFAFSMRDMERLVTGGDMTFPKPRFASVENGIEFSNIPVPSFPYLVPWLTVNSSLFSESSLLGKLLPKKDDEYIDDLFYTANQITAELILKLQELQQMRNASIAVVVLPAPYMQMGTEDQWRRAVIPAIRERGVRVIDASNDSTIGELLAKGLFFGDDNQMVGMAHEQVAEVLFEELPSPAGGPWRARYYSDIEFQDELETQYHSISSLYWPDRRSVGGESGRGFGVILDTCLELEERGRFRVRLESGGRATFSANQQMVLETGADAGEAGRVNVIDLPAGTNELRLRYRDTGQEAFVRLMFQTPDGKITVPGPGLLEEPGSGGCQESENVESNGN